MSSLLTSRVDRLPLALRLPVEIYGVVGGAAIEVMLRVIGAWFRLEREGLEERRALGPVIECLWHQHAFPYVIGSRKGERRVTLFHPLVVFRPAQMVMRWRGWRMEAGSSGNDGRAGADQLVQALQEGYSPLMTPDGPAGPPKKLKPGVLHIARQSGRPIVPIRFEYSHAATLRGWDSKLLPLPGSVVRQRFGAPIWVGDDLEAAAAELEAALGP